MRLWKNWSRIALAILWVVMAAMAMADFASFSAATAPGKAVVRQSVGALGLSQGRQTPG